MDRSDITFRGRLTADPDLRYDSEGRAFARLRVAVNRRVKRGDDWDDAPPTFWDVACNGRLAENVDQSLAKGNPVAVTGQVITEEWTDKDGDTRRSLKVRASDVAVSLEWATVTVGEGVHAQDANAEERAATD